MEDEKNLYSESARTQSKHPSLMMWLPPKGQKCAYPGANTFSLLQSRVKNIELHFAPARLSQMTEAPEGC